MAKKGRANLLAHVVVKGLVDPLAVLFDSPNFFLHA